MAPNSRYETPNACCRDPLYTAALTCGAIQLVASILLIITGIILCFGVLDALGAYDLEDMLEDFVGLDAESRLKLDAIVFIIIMGVVGVGLSGMLISGIRERNVAKLRAWNVLAALSLLSAFRFGQDAWYMYPVPIISFIITINFRVGREQQEGVNRSESKV